MPDKINPFRPNSPVYSGMFVGRMNEIKGIDRALFQTKNGNPSHIMLTGERGIGKTSLLLYAQHIAKGELQLEQKYNFLTVQINITDKMSVTDLAIGLKGKLQRELNKINPEIALIEKFWGFVSKFEAVGYKKESETLKPTQQTIEDFTYSLADTVRNITQESLAQELGFHKKMDGLVILIDEADRAGDELDFGVFLKNLTEMLVAEGCNNIIIILAGLPNVPNVLRKSHESSLRLFSEYHLTPLSKNEVDQVINDGIRECNIKSGTRITIEKEALDAIYDYSEGYPHFVQQLGFSTLEVDDDENINKQDVMKGFFGKNGALERIGNTYYKKLYYDEINTEVQREILTIMSERWSEWVGRDFIKAQFSKPENAMDNGLRALISKNIILAKVGTRGQYRLQWASFAFWIKNHKKIEA